MTKYEELYGVKVDDFPNEEANVRKKLKLVTDKISELDYEYQLKLHELNQAKVWCRKILEDIEDN